MRNGILVFFMAGVFLFPAAVPSGGFFPAVTSADAEDAAGTGVPAPWNPSVSGAGIDSATASSSDGEPDIPELKTTLPDSSGAPVELPAGPVNSIKIVGNHFRSDGYLRERLNVFEGRVYSREEIAAAVARLREDPLIDYVSFDFWPDGELRIFVYEKRPFEVDFGLEGAFTRVSGFGLGASLAVSGREMVVSGIEGYGRYDWAAERWAGGVTVSKKIPLRAPLVIGGGYRDDFASNMDWAIPPDDARANAFFLGRSLENYFRETGSFGFLSQSLGEQVILRAEYFERRYASVEKETDWSFFDYGAGKRDNPAISTVSGSSLTGARFSVNLRRVTTVMDFRGRFEVERTYRYYTDDYPAYTRFFGTGSWNMRYWHGHLVKFRVAGGYSPHDLPDQRSFQLGGQNTLRGYDALSLPGDASADSSSDGADRMFLANVDYFYGENLSLIFFGDVGGVWRKGEAVAASGASGLRRDLGIGLAFGSDFFSSVEKEHKAGFRVNCAIPVGPVSHGAHWTVNFVRAY